jgi:MOSC domain-containing protein YiiM
MKLLSVNVSLPQEVRYKNDVVTTGIFKEPVQGHIMLRRLNLDGDGQADLENHGGFYRAVYAYSIENYNYWKRELRRSDFSFGQFGENFTVEGMLEDEIHIGDVFRVGGAMVQVTQPRPPCFKLGIKMGMAQFPKRFLASSRVGFYLRVCEEGEVGAGDTFERIKVDSEQMSVREVNQLLFFDTDDIERAKKAVRIESLAPGWRKAFAERLSDAGVIVEYRHERSDKKECCGP